MKKGEEDLKDLELDIAAPRHAVIHRLDNGRVGTGGDGGEQRVIVADLAFESRNILRCEGGSGSKQSQSLAEAGVRCT